MDTAKPTTTPPEPASGTAGKNGRPERGRRRWEMTAADIRYFLVKPGSTADKPELGREIASEGEALVEAFRSGQTFFTLVAWKAVPEMASDGPKIVKQAMTRT